jgi:hypothetical protein
MKRLLDIAHARSGDKGDICNIGVIAREPRFYPVLVRELTPERVKAWLDRQLGDVCRGPVERYELPNLDALNFVLHNALDGGGLASLRYDRQGKTYGARLLRMPLDLPEDIGPT